MVKKTRATRIRTAVRMQMMNVILARTSQRRDKDESESQVIGRSIPRREGRYKASGERYFVEA